MNSMVSSDGSFGGVVGPVERSQAAAAAAARPLQKRPRHETTSSPSVAGLMLGGNLWSTIDRELELELELELGQPRRQRQRHEIRTSSLEESRQQIRDQQRHQQELLRQAQLIQQQQQARQQERALDDPAHLRLQEACYLSHEYLQQTQQQQQQQQRRQQREALLLGQQQRPAPQFGPLLTQKHKAEWAELRRRIQDETTQLRARQDAERAQSARDAEFAIHEAELAQQRRHQRARLLVSRSAEIASIIRRQRGLFAQERDFVIADRAIVN